MTGQANIGAIEASLHRRFRVVETEVRILDRTLSILHPASAEDLIDERDFDRDERLPYWAELWPSSRNLAEQILGLAGAGRTFIELGCGAGLVAVCASLAGFDVVASDYYEDAVRFARVNAHRNGAAPIQGLHLDWRHLPTSPALPRFDVVAASDVLYERPYGGLVARVLDATLGSEGVALLADPGRVGRADFLQALEPLGLGVSRQTITPFDEGQVHQNITTFEVVWRNQPDQNI